jgi:hypothetical protein
MEIYYFHGTTKDGYRYTIAGEFVMDGSVPVDLLLGIAVCSAADHFKKSFGREKAAFRLANLPNTLTGTKVRSLYFEALEQATRVILGYPEVAWFKSQLFIAAVSGYNKLTRKKLMSTFNLHKADEKV